MRISDWSSDVCSSDLEGTLPTHNLAGAGMRGSTEPGGLVLIVEDNRNISEMVGEYLEGRGFEVDYASDGLDGYRLAAENTYDVIVLDLMLPRLDGIEVCKRLDRKSTRLNSSN